MCCAAVALLVVIIGIALYIETKRTSALRKVAGIIGLEFAEKKDKELMARLQGFP